MTSTMNPATTSDDPNGHIAEPDPTAIYALDAGAGRHLHALDNLATLKTAAGANASMAVVEFSAPRGFGPPLHAHTDEDEFLFIVDGMLDVHIGDHRRTVEAGGFVWLPSGSPHTFQVLSDTCRMLSVTADASGDAQFDAMFAELGDDTEDVTIPSPMAIDPGHVAQVCARHGVEILGPPPAPLGGDQA